MGIDAVEVPEGGLTVLGGGVAVLVLRRRSAASLTLVGTRFSLIAPPVAEEVDVGADELSLAILDGLKVVDASEAVAHGEGRGLSGDTIDADVERLVTVFGPKDALPPPEIDILRVSKDEGLRNSEARLCLCGLWIKSQTSTTMIAFLLFLRCCTHLATPTGAVLSLSRRGLGGPMTSFPFPLSLKLPLPLPSDDPEPEAVSQLAPQPSPSIFPSFDPSFIVEGIATGLCLGLSSPTGSSSGLPKAKGLDPATLAGAGTPKPLELPLLSLLVLEDTDVLSLDCPLVTFSNRREPGCVGDSFLITRGGDCLEGGGKFPAKDELLPDLLFFMRRPPGVRICGREAWLGLDGREVDGLPERLLDGFGLAVRARGNCSAGRFGVPLPPDIAGEDGKLSRWLISVSSSEWFGEE